MELGWRQPNSDHHLDGTLEEGEVPDSGRRPAGQFNPWAKALELSRKKDGQGSILDPVRKDLSKTLDNLHDSLFNVGGSQDEAGRKGKPNPFHPARTGESQASIYNRTRMEMEHMKRQYEGYNNELNQITKARNSLQADTEVERRALAEEIRSLKEQRKECDLKLNRDYQEAKQAQDNNYLILDDQQKEISGINQVIDELTHEKEDKDNEVVQLSSKVEQLRKSCQLEIDSAVTLKLENDRIGKDKRRHSEESRLLRKKLLEENQELETARGRRIEELARLEARRIQLDQYMLGTNPNAEQSRIPDFHEVHGQEGPIDGAGQDPVSSTPAPRRLEDRKESIAEGSRHVGFDPFINNNGGRHVDPSSVYRSSEDYTDDYGPYTGHSQAGDDGRQPNCGPPPQSGCAQQSQQRNPNGNSNQNNGNVRPVYNRRSSMSAAMQSLHDTNPCIAGLGIDCYSKTMDGAEIMNWTLLQGNRLRGADNAARRVAKTPRPYNGVKPWKEEYPNFLDDMEASGWTKTQSLPHLVNWLKEGPGKVAVEQWRAEYGYHGSYDDLVTCASYLFGTLVAEDPMTTFKKRTQKPKESYKVFGLELQGLLKQARPEWRYDSEYFLQDLFLTFISGLRDEEHGKVATEAWTSDSSLQDLFLAIDNFDRKRRLFGNRFQSRTSAIYSEEPGVNVSEGDPEPEEDENISAFRTNDGKFNRNDKTRQGNQKWKSDGKSDKKPYVENKEYSKPNPNKAKDPVVDTTPVSVVIPQSVIDQMIKQILEGLKRPPQDPADKTCFRCQVKGHMSGDCTAEKPVPRPWRQDRKENE